MQKKNNGKFYLRIDDTDTTRSTDEYKNSIISALTQLGLKHDDEITYQSNRFDHYIDKIEELLNKDMAYYDKVEVNEKTKETDLSVQYENRLNKEGYVIRFKNQKERSIVINDSVHGEITFDPKVFFDVVILRSNGVPTYNLTSVVDDIDLGITHLIRGDDHLSNLPVQVNLFKSLNAKVPAFAHLPMIHGVDGKRLSKRHGAVDINHFLNEGYRVDAILNYLAKTGWSHGDQEIFSIEQLIELFDLDRITKSAAAFDIEKMNWLNQHYIKNDSIENIADQILPFLSSIQLPNEPKKR
jgi:glutamyl-tRNA synthetase